MPNPATVRSFRSAEDYLRALHPDFSFLFRIVDVAVENWSYSVEAACELQSNMVALACEHAKKLDAARGVQIVIEDETCSAAAVV